ncbi:MAG: hypothetical protein ABW042_10130 [Phenylobacterium sp.]
MPRRNPARIPLAARRATCEGVEAMRRQGWDVISHCPACGLTMRVDLAALAILKGSDFSLWDRRARCRRIGCAGYASFQARAPDMSWHDALRTSPA